MKYNLLVWNLNESGEYLTGASALSTHDSVEACKAALADWADPENLQARIETAPEETYGPNGKEQDEPRILEAWNGEGWYVN